MQGSQAGPGDEEQAVQIRRWAMAPLVAVVAGLGLVACGGGGSPATDEEYVRAVCNTVGALQDRMADLQGDAATATDEDALAEVMDNLSEALGDAADDLDDVNPPDDVAGSHNDVVEAFKDAADALGEGNLDALDEFDPGAIKPDAAIQERLSAAAREVEECSELDLF
jgi:hypothetical protein